MKTLNQILLATLATAALSAQAQDLLITNATVHTMGEDGVLENTDILVEDGAIRRIGSDLRAPNGVAVIDANGRNVTPALFAGITTIGLAEGALDTNTVGCRCLKAEALIRSYWLHHGHRLLNSRAKVAGRKYLDDNFSGQNRI